MDKNTGQLPAILIEENLLREKEGGRYVHTGKRGHPVRRRGL